MSITTPRRTSRQVHVALALHDHLRWAGDEAGLALVDLMLTALAHDHATSAQLAWTPTRAFEHELHTARQDSCVYCGRIDCAVMGRGQHRRSSEVRV